jgi:MoaA/NifB/PqqE/SkfB family radical SAM enzyme
VQARKRIADERAKKGENDLGNAMGIFDMVFPRNTPPPLHLDWLQIEVSARCNSSCCYCPTSCYHDEWEGGLMEMDTFERLRPYLPFCDLVFLQGWGEPLLHPRFWEMARQTKEAGAVTGFTTNATLLDQERQLQLLDTGVDIMAVSLAGVTAETQARLRDGCSLERIGESLMELQRLKRERGTEKPQVHIAFMMLRSNWRQVGGLADLAAQWGVSQVVVSDLSWIGDQTGESESLLEHQDLWPDVASAVEQAQRAARAKGIGFHYQGPSTGQPAATCTENVIKACYVSYSGEVSPCPFARLGFGHRFEGEPVAAAPIVFGNVRSDTLPKIWDSAAARDFRSSFERRQSTVEPGVDQLPEPCKRCYKLRK